MKVFSKITDTSEYVLSLKKQGLILGFVPTMGALHSGHLSLIEKSCRENNQTACSIFINPIQFNNKEDFEKYPVQFEKDIEMLRQSGCDLVFIPSVAEMYPQPSTDVYDFGMLGKVMEGEFREGHFNGVAIVVKKLLDIIQPERAYFGEKDFQQLQIIKHLVKTKHISVEIIPCPIIRENDGLAMSSRNVRLSHHEREIAPEIFRILQNCFSVIPEKSVAEVKSLFLSSISQFPEFRVDYFEIAVEETLQPVSSWLESKNVRLFVAVFLGNVRLIDNMKIIL